MRLVAVVQGLGKGTRRNSATTADPPNPVDVGAARRPR